MAMDNANHPDEVTSTPDDDEMMLATALVLCKKGLSPIWLRGKSPFESDWQIKETKSVDELRQSYVHGYNLGIRCGKWSHPKPGYGLVVVDVDVNDSAYAQVHPHAGDLFHCAGLTRFQHRQPQMPSGKRQLER
jgi:hypothetical protein